MVYLYIFHFLTTTLLLQLVPIIKGSHEYARTYCLGMRIVCLVPRLYTEQSGDETKHETFLPNEKCLISRDTFPDEKCHVSGKQLLPDEECLLSKKQLYPLTKCLAAHGNFYP